MASFSYKTLLCAESAVYMPREFAWLSKNPFVSIITVPSLSLYYCNTKYSKNQGYESQY